MTFEAYETGPKSQPIEYITLKNGANIWQYTNSNITEQIGARSFAPLAYTRNEPAFSKDTSDGRVKMRIPSSLPIVAFYETIPSSQTSAMMIERVNRNDPDQGVQVYWKGQFASVQRDGLFATILAVPPTQLPAQIPRYAYTGLCNWFLFQDRCGLERENWQHVGDVVSVQSDTVFTVTGLRDQAAVFAGLGGGALTAQEIDDYWLGGYVSNEAGEKRSIYQTDVDGVPDRIRILQPFATFDINDSVTVYAGCARTRDVCFRKFDNTINHGGFPDIPTVNPFTTELPPGTASPEKKVWFGN